MLVAEGYSRFKKRYDHNQRYGQRHRTIRAQWAPQVAMGTVRCCSDICGHQLIQPGSSWHLMHDDSDPTGQTYRGPGHSTCNLGEAQRKADIALARRRGQPIPVHYNVPEDAPADCVRRTQPAALKFFCMTDDGCTCPD